MITNVVNKIFNKMTPNQANKTNKIFYIFQKQQIILYNQKMVQQTAEEEEEAERVGGWIPATSLR